MKLTWNTVYGHQYGFRKKHSTIHPILHLLNYIADSSDKPSKDITLGLFLDLSKAFNTISHPILLHKLNYYGIRGVCNDWFRSYLTNRKQYTETYSKSSSYASITCGVPQGSIFGSHFISPIHKRHTKLHIFKFVIICR